MRSVFNKLLLAVKCLDSGFQHLVYGCIQRIKLIYLRFRKLQWFSLLQFETAKLFDQPVYNFTREFPFIWEEMHVPIPYRADRTAAERILLEAAWAVTVESREASDRARDRVQRAYGVNLEQHEPRVFWRITDNWIDLAVRYVVPEHGIREIKDALTRRVLSDFDRAGIEIASTTMAVTSVPAITIQPTAAGTG